MSAITRMVPPHNGHKANIKIKDSFEPLNPSQGADQFIFREGSEAELRSFWSVFVYETRKF